ncbi:MAG: hypothetical protein FWC45_01695 [Treponema sp.]|nr:hypothetical protein [Treponema sp.]
MVFPAGEDQTKIEAFKGEVKAARRSDQVDYSDLQTRISLVTSAHPGKGFVSGFLTSFHHSTACGSRGLRLRRPAALQARPPPGFRRLIL